MFTRNQKGMLIVAGFIALWVGWATAPWMWSGSQYEDGSARYGWSNIETGEFVGMVVQVDD